MKKLIGLVIILSLFFILGETFYLHSSFAKSNQQKKLNIEKLDFSKQTLKEGKTLYKRHCVTCHGIKGYGDGPGATNLNPKPRNLKEDKLKYGESYNEILKLVSNGIPKSKDMVPWKNVLSKKQLESISAYVKTLRKN